MNVYNRCSGKTKCMYFMIKDEKCFEKYMAIWEKVSNIMKKVNSELMYNKSHLKAEKRCNTKESFHCYQIPVTLFDSVYGKDENYYPKVFFKIYS